MFPCLLEQRYIYHLSADKTLEFQVFFVTCFADIFQLSPKRFGNCGLRFKKFICKTSRRICDFGLGYGWSRHTRIYPIWWFHSSIHQCLYSRFVGPRPLLQFRDLLTQTVGLLGRVISPSQGLYLYTGQHKHRLNAHTNIHASSRIRTYDPNVRASEDSSCLRPLGCRDRPIWWYICANLIKPLPQFCAWRKHDL
jgi:hypothetical protein